MSYLLHVISNKIHLAVFLSMFLTVVSPLAHAASPRASLCQETFSEDGLKSVSDILGVDYAEAYKEMNDFYQKKYPALGALMKDPHGFLEEMQGRFNLRKESGQDPYRFHFKEVGEQAIETVVLGLTETQTYIHSEIQKIKKELEKGVLFKPRPTSKWQKLLREYEVAAVYGQELLSHTQQIQKENYPYRDVVEVSYYASRLMGHFQFRELSLYQKMTNWIDLLVNGYRQLGIEREFDMYKNRAQTPWAPVSQVPVRAKVFAKAEEPFSLAFSDPQNLNFVVIPTGQALNRGVFQRLMPIQIHFMGVTSKPILADGFNRPGGLFWMHDAKHESAKFYRRLVYRILNGLTEKQMRFMDRAAEIWQRELHGIITEIEDKPFRDTVNLFYFNFHHDQGNPFIPSSFLRYRDPFIINSLFLQMELANDPALGSARFSLLKKSEEWLEKFWKTKKKYEEELLRRIKNGTIK